MTPTAAAANDEMVVCAGVTPSVLQLAGQMSLQQCLHKHKQIKPPQSLANHVRGMS